MSKNDLKLTNLMQGFSMGVTYHVFPLDPRPNLVRNKRKKKCRENRRRRTDVRNVSYTSKQTVAIVVL